MWAARGVNTFDIRYPRLIAHAYRPWCDEHGMHALVEEYAPLPDPFTAELDAVRRLLDHDPRPDAVLGVYSDSGHNILAAARHHRHRVPQDLLVACISEDPDYAATTRPSPRSAPVRTWWATRRSTC
ncbi:substrate-binding domain-containing protein [Streptomyces sp. NPDC056479]|uniref:substrate-binding domain-containing protein n=1 Tax=unclassified Streptomyces TaxID=2593676 RepID=UPI00367B3200